MSRMTWEEAVQWLREQPEQEPLVQACYFDDPLLDAAERFTRSAEWQAVREFVPAEKGRALDLGAGRGISSYALASDGWEVTALEPDASGLVGAGAIRMLAREAGLSISVVEQPGEQLPFPSRSFDLVHGRQVLHHSADLTRLCREVARVLKPGGRMIATREHVITRPSDLPVFLDSHPLHKLYGGEQAYLVSEYVAAITGSGLAIGRILGPFDSAINYFPMSHSQWRRYCLEPLTWVLGERLAARVVDDGWPWGPWVLGRLARIRSAFCDAPGRLYTFLADRAR